MRLAGIPNTFLPHIFSPASAPAHEIYRLAIFVIVICAGIFVVVTSVGVYAVAKFRRRPQRLGAHAGAGLWQPSARAGLDGGAAPLVAALCSWHLQAAPNGPQLIWRLPAPRHAGQ